MKKGQSNRLTDQQKEGQGPITIFHKDAQIHDAEVGNTSLFVKYVAMKIAEVKNIPLADVAELTKNNAKRIFKIED